MRDESLLLGGPTLRDINAALERLMEQARQRRHRYRVQQRSRTAATITKSQEIAEALCFWQAALAIVFPDKKLPHGTRTRIIDWVCRQHGLSRPQFYKLLKSVDPTVATELRRRAETFAREWAEERRNCSATIRETTS